MVWNQWRSYHCCIRNLLRLGAYQVRPYETVADVSPANEPPSTLTNTNTLSLTSIFLFVGLITILSAPFVYWKLDNDIPSARFLTPHERAQAIERLRANQTGTGNRQFKWHHVLETILEPKTYLWFAMALLLNVGASVTNTFGPLILSGFGFNSYRTSLLNIPFGAVQILVILLASYAAQRARLKSAVLATLMLPVLAGLVILYLLQRNRSDQPALLAAYYLLAFLFGGNPLIVVWIVGNTAGTTKKSIIMSLYNAGSSAGNIIGPLLFHEKDKPRYHPGLRAVLAIFVAMIAVVLVQLANLMVLNRWQRKRRVRNGKKAVIVDSSMADRYVGMEEEENEVYAERAPAGGGVAGRLGDNAFLDLTDRQNDEFTYIY